MSSTNKHMLNWSHYCIMLVLCNGPKKDAHVYNEQLGVYFPPQASSLVKSSQLKSSHLYLYSAFHNTNCIKATAQYQHFWVKGISLLNSVMSSSSSVQFSLNSICAIKSVISLEIKCPQLSKPEATTARTQNSIGDRTEKKNLVRNQTQSGGQFPSGQTNQ